MRMGRKQRNIHLLPATRACSLNVMKFISDYRCTAYFLQRYGINACNALAYYIYDQSMRTNKLEKSTFAMHSDRA